MKDEIKILLSMLFMFMLIIVMTIGYPLLPTFITANVTYGLILVGVIFTMLLYFMFS